MKKPVYIIVAIVLVALIAGFFILSGDDSSNTNQELGETPPDTVNTTEKASVDDGQETPDITPPEEDEEPEETVVVSDLVQDPNASGFPIENNHYRIVQPKNTTNNYSVTLFAIINSPAQYNEYRAQLKQFKSEALQYMEENGVDTSTATITYSPSEANDL